MITHTPHTTHTPDSDDSDDSSSSSTRTPGAPLRHKAVPWPDRRFAFRDTWRDRSLSSFLDGFAAIDGRTLYLVGGDKAATTPERSYWLEPTEAGHDWQMSNYTPGPGGNLHPSGARYKRGSGHAIDVYMSARWFGAEASAEACRAAANILIAELRKRFDRGAHMMGTPARTGLDLLQRSLPRQTKDKRDVVYPPLDPVLRDTLYDTQGQGRIEYIPPAPGAGAGEELSSDGLYWLDGRWMYASCMRNLPVGEARLDDEFDYLGMAPAFYRVTWRVPSDWPYPFGILAEQYDDAGETRRRWPARPGTWHHSWVSGAELAFAYEKGYTIHIHERLHWSGGLPDPTAEWIKRLRELRAETPNKLVYAATRHIVIDTAGAWWRQVQPRLHSTPRQLAHTIPASAYGHVAYPDRIEWLEDTPMIAELRPHIRAEWTATVWGRSLAKLARAACRYMDEYGNAGGRVAWMRSDALVVTRRPEWIDDGTIGTFRLKRELSSPVVVPATEEEYEKLLQGQRQKG